MEEVKIEEPKKLTKKEYMKEWRIKNKEKVKEYSKKWNEENKEMQKSKRTQRIECEVCKKLVEKCKYKRHLSSSLCKRKSKSGNNMVKLRDGIFYNPEAIKEVPREDIEKILLYINNVILS
ncbi:MAG TPA: hypothetical protein VN703_07480 [Candidatus Sulfopaludibacter sp.]|nr:hypothetical protein [Candidatus Sulfopaludibacter sp.]